MAKYQKYAEYKDSGVEWVDDIPSTWEVKPVFALFTPEMEKNLDGIETNVLSLSYGRIIQRDVENNHGLLPESFNTYQIVNDGDIILRLTDLQNDKRSLRVGLATQKGIITSAYLKLSALKEIDPKFAYRLLHSYDTTKVFYGMGGGLRQSMKFEDFRRLPILVPPKSEQTQIANFLDHETAKIDTLIAKQEKLIELLKEKRQAVISHAVTKGLNPDVTMKDSGVEWLGQVPEHWITSKLKYFAVIQGGFAFSSDLFIEEGIQVLRIGNVYQNSLSLDRQPIFIANDLVKKYEDFIVKKDDVLISLTGTLGKRDYGFAIKVETNDQYLLNQRVAKISPNKNIDTDFMVYVLWSESYLTQLYSLPSGTKQANLSNSDVLGIEIVVPPTMQEQKQIARYIKEKLEKFDEMISKAESAIQLMQERRTALISSAVTGKIDVRNWQDPNEAKTELSL
ncbi:restriction endonuclease subunit S [Acinetobacter lwoffii]|uniref:restriction endonuclease subunit S n=1 Tax=Acinetobacter lwoffii TaxID=28090 RepID=UPI0012988109|nr:restriction endonuclease subunit S [Acinetobacter lwoffii]MDP1318057.1 restriction endonuclease subunit S [Acinetobacter lwoffii]MRA03453.1 restriction endonuclease subunit S [Acinetobacter lwoffii]